MRIAVNSSSNNQQEGFDIFLAEMLLTMAERNGEHTFLFFDAPKIHPARTYPANTTLVPVKSAANGVLARVWWNNVTLPRLLKQYRPDVLLQTISYYHPNQKVTSVVLDDAATLPAKAKILVTPQKITGLSRFVTFSENRANAYRENFPWLAQQLVMIPACADPLYQPIEWQEKELVKERFASGCEYFFVDAGKTMSKQQVINVLKAFSLFKIRQRTNLKLVICSRTKNMPGAEELETYKFREGVRVVEFESLAQHVKLVAGAYALLYTERASVVPVMQAMQSGVPVICHPGFTAEFTTDNLVLPCEMHDPQDIAEQFKRIYKDEDLRNRLVQQGLLVAGERSREKTAGLLWDTISRPVAI